METFLFAVETTTPVFLMIVIGYVLKRIGLFCEEYGETATTLCFRIFLPVSVAFNIYESKTNIAEERDLIGFMYIGIFLILGISFFLVPRFVGENRTRSVVMQGIYRSNALLLGVPLAYNMHGSGGTGPSVILIATGVPLMNCLAVILFEMYRENSADVKILLKRVSIGFVTNPLIIAAVVGLSLVQADFVLPDMVESLAADIGGVALPLALLALGATFHLQGAVKNLKVLLLVGSLKLLLVPAVMLTAALLLGFRGPELTAVLTIFAMPCAVSGYVMAKEMGGNSALAGELVVFTTMLSSVTLMAAVYLFKLMNFL